MPHLTPVPENDENEVSLVYLINIQLFASLFAYVAVLYLTTLYMVILPNRMIAVLAAPLEVALMLMGPEPTQVFEPFPLGALGLITLLFFLLFPHSTLKEPHDVEPAERNWADNILTHTNTIALSVGFYLMFSDGTPVSQISGTLLIVLSTVAFVKLHREKDEPLKKTPSQCVMDKTIERLADPSEVASVSEHLTGTLCLYFVSRIYEILILHKSEEIEQQLAPVFIEELVRFSDWIEECPFEEPSERDDEGFDLTQLVPLLNGLSACPAKWTPTRWGRLIFWWTSTHIFPQLITALYEQADATHSREDYEQAVYRLTKEAGRCFIQAIDHLSELLEPCEPVTNRQLMTYQASELVVEIGDLIEADPLLDFEVLTLLGIHIVQTRDVSLFDGPNAA